MRQSQKTDQYSGRQRRISLEGREQLGARSTTSGECTVTDGVSFQSLILSRDNLNLAYKRVRRNKGAAGIDGMTTVQALPYLKAHGSALVTALSEGTYKPQPVKRVEIPKPEGSKRKLGIPTVVDRIVQQAVAQVLSPVFEEIFSDNSFGFRPHRSAQDAVQRVVTLYQQGYHYVVDLDLKAYFDTVNHDLLIKFLKQYVDDPWLLHLIRRFLTSGVMNGKLFEQSEKGTPQGGPISPLLANVYLNELDKLLAARGHQFVRYADDCNIYVKSKRAGYRVLASITKFLETTLKVTVNQKKTKVGSPLRLNFLGFSLGVSHQGVYARPSRKAKQRVIKTLRQLTKRNRGRSLNVIFREIRIKMRGWLQYYSIGKMTNFVVSLDQWLRSRIRQYIWKMWKKPKTRAKALMKLGMLHNQAWKFAETRKGYWHTAHSKTLTYTITNKRLEHRGLINLSQTLQSIESKRNA
jgi:group II intron reverse transcriptase/maturase